MTFIKSDKSPVLYLLLLQNKLINILFFFPPQYIGKKVEAKYMKIVW